MTGRRLRLVAIGVLLLTGGCASGESGFVKIDEQRVPFRLLDPDAPPVLTTAPAGDANTYSVCLLDEEDRLVPVTTTADGAPGPRSALRELAPDAGPANQPTELRTALPEHPAVSAVQITAGLARVDLTPAMASLGADRQRLAIAQIVCTLTELPGVGQVTFTLDGSPIEVPTGGGSLASDPVSRDDYLELIAG